MTKTEEILRRMNILIYQIAESVERGDIDMGWVKKPSDEIDELIDELSKPTMD